MNFNCFIIIPHPVASHAARWGNSFLIPLIDFDIDTKAKTFKGIFEVHTSTDDDVVVLGGETTLHKK